MQALFLMALEPLAENLADSQKTLQIHHPFDNEGLQDKASSPCLHYEEKRQDAPVRNPYHQGHGYASPLPNGT